jgi:antitoxin ParD1/3/4
MKMSNIERITITLTSDMAEAVKTAVAAGEYASSSEVIREALRDWRHKHALRQKELEELKANIRRGLDDVDAGKVHDFDPERIIKKGESKLAGRASSE